METYNTVRKLQLKIQWIAILILATILFGGNNAFGQLQDAGTPASFSITNKTLSNYSLKTYSLPLVDNSELLSKEDKTDTKRFQFAYGFDVAITPENSGSWTIDGDLKIWQLEIKSETAYSINLIFDKFKLPDGASLYVYTPNHDVLYGAFTENNNKDHGKFAIRPLPGNSLIVEYNEPIDANFKGEIEISKINHDYKGVSGLKYDPGRRPAGVSQECEQDINCEKDPLWLTIKQSVVRILVDGKWLCSGTLLNNVEQDKTPYIITAGHCFYNNASEQLIVTSYSETACIAFNYESPSCTTIDGYTEQTLIGGIARASDHDLDFFLLELEDELLPEFEAVYSGWNLKNTNIDNTTTIHHPSGDVKKISKDLDQPTTADYKDSYLAQGFWKIDKWDLGSTEGGSSGGGLFNSDAQLIGTLTGGAATCSYPMFDYFSKFNLQWDYYNKANSQLKTWLDPNNTGTTSIGSLATSDKEGNACLTIQNFLQDTEKASLLYTNLNEIVVGNNSQNLLEISEYFEQNSTSFVTSIKVVMGEIVNTSQDITLKIYSVNNGLPGNVLHSQTVPVASLVKHVENIIDLKNGNGKTIYLEIEGSYFVSFELDNSNTSNQFSLYSVPANANTAYALTANGWTKFSTISNLESPSISLMLRVANCGGEPTGSDSTLLNPNKPVQILYDSSQGNVIYLKTNELFAKATLRIYNSLGQVFDSYEELVSTTPKKLDLSSYTPGIYFLSISTNDIRQTEKIIVH